MIRYLFWRIRVVGSLEGTPPPSSSILSLNRDNQISFEFKLDNIFTLSLLLFFDFDFATTSPLQSSLAGCACVFTFILAFTLYFCLAKTECFLYWILVFNIYIEMQSAMIMFDQCSAISHCNYVSYFPNMSQYKQESKH